jgi:hypothetical protein
MCADVTINTAVSKEIHTMKEGSPITAIVHGEMDTRQRAFTAIWKDNQVFRRLVCSRENQEMGLLDLATVE